MRGMLPCTPSQVHHYPEDAAREPRFGPLFLEVYRPGLQETDFQETEFRKNEDLSCRDVARYVSRSHDGQLRLSWSARSTLSSKIILSFWLLASSSWLNHNLVWLEASG